MEEEGKKEKKQPEKPVGKKAKFDPSAKKREEQEKKKNESKVDSNNDLDKLTGYGDLKDGKVPMDDGKEYIIKPYTIKNYKIALDLFEKMRDPNLMDSKVVIKTTMDLILLALKRTYPDLTIEYLEEHMDLRGTQTAMKSIYHFFGLDRLVPIEKKNNLSKL